MKWSSVFIVGLIILSGLLGCHHDDIKQYPNTQSRFAYDQSFRLGKWYCISDTTGNSRLGVNTLLDTIWFINDSLAGWTGFKPDQHEYVFWKTYIDPESMYNLIYLAPGNPDTTKTDTISHQFGFPRTGDTLTIYWDFNRTPPLIERYLKKKD